VTAGENKRDQAVYAALVRLEPKPPALPFETTRIAIAVESGLRPMPPIAPCTGSSGTATSTGTGFAARARSCRSSSRGTV